MSRSSPTMPELRRQARARMRDAVVDAALELLRTGGPGAVSVRRVAAAVGASTQVVATHFTDKQGLLDALYTRGFTALRTATAAAAGVRGRVTAYRRFALHNADLYKLMFTRGDGHYTPGAQAAAAAAAAFGVLVDVVPGGDRAAAHFVWAVAHGHVSLEIAGLLSGSGDADELYDAAVAHIEAVLAAPPLIGRPPAAR